MIKVIAYKVFNPDWTCRGFPYKVGKSYTHKGNLSMCGEGFHACKKVSDCFSYYSFDPKNKVAEVELSGTILGLDEEKQCASKIKIIRELKWPEVLVLANSGNGNSGNGNSGNRNSGYGNSGNRNSGSRNSGYGNSGYGNSGNRNSGDGNSGNRNSGNGNSGDFNTNEPFIRMFNKETKLYRKDIDYPSYFNFDLCVWILFSNMTDEEKKTYPNASVCDGYLKKLDFKEAWKLAFKQANKQEIEATKNLPNFDAKIFFEITGIDYFIKNK